MRSPLLSPLPVCPPLDPLRGCRLRLKSRVILGHWAIPQWHTEGPMWFVALRWQSQCRRRGECMAWQIQYYSYQSIQAYRHAYRQSSNKACRSPWRGVREKVRRRPEAVVQSPCFRQENAKTCPSSALYWQEQATATGTLARLPFFFFFFCLSKWHYYMTIII